MKVMVECRCTLRADFLNVFMWTATREGVPSYSLSPAIQTPYLLSTVRFCDTDQVTPRICGWNPATIDLLAAGK